MTSSYVLSPLYTLAEDFVGANQYVRYSPSSIIDFSGLRIERKPYKFSSDRPRASTPKYYVGDDVAYYGWTASEDPEPGLAVCLCDRDNDMDRRYPDYDIPFKIMYYGFGGPGFDKSMWPKTDWNGEPLTDDVYYVCTYLMIAEHASKDYYGTDNANRLGMKGIVHDWMGRNIIGICSEGDTRCDTSVFRQIISKELPKDDIFW